MGRVKSLSADCARRRLLYAVALDRTRVDGRQRVSAFYGKAGSRVVFDEVVSVLPGEGLMTEFSVNAAGEVCGQVIVTCTVFGESE